VKIEVRKRVVQQPQTKYTTLTITCAECGRNNKGRSYIGIECTYSFCLYLCPSCLATLRSKIDALSILVQTGIDTNADSS
jgi:hypothetical protein